MKIDYKFKVTADDGTVKYYDYVWISFTSLYIVKLDTKRGFIDIHGREICEIKYDDANDFCEGLARVKLNDKYGFINKQGIEVIKVKYDKASNFVDGQANVTLGIIKWQIDIQGNKV